MKKQLTVNTGPVMFSEEIYYTDPLIQLTKLLVKHSFSWHNLLRYKRSSRYVLKAYLDGRKANSLFSRQSFLSNNYYLYMKIYFEIFVTNDFFSIFWRTVALKRRTCKLHTTHITLQTYQRNVHIRFKATRNIF